MPRNTADWTPERWEEHRAYLAEKKRESRERQKERGECTVRSPWCEGKAAKGGSTCKECNRYAMEWERKQGWQPRPFKEIAKLAKRMKRDGMTIDQIIADPAVQDWGQDRTKKELRAEVSGVLRNAGLL